MENKLYLLIIIFSIGLYSCADPSRPNYQYFPNMYESVGYKTYADSDAFSNGIEAQKPVKGTVPRGWEPYDYQDTNEGYEAAKANLISPLEITKENMKMWTCTPHS